LRLVRGQFAGAEAGVDGGRRDEGANRVDDGARQQADPWFAANYDKYGAGTAAFVRDVMAYLRRAELRLRPRLLVTGAADPVTTTVRRASGPLREAC
jgi:hypothetical protein